MVQLAVFSCNLATVYDKLKMLQLLPLCCLVIR